MHTSLAHVFRHRRAGILLHPTSLPGVGENGTLGKAAHAFIDRLHACGISLWQMLPLGPTHDDGSPYQCLSSHAGNPRLICRESLFEQGILDDPKQPVTSALRAFLHRADTAERQAYALFLQSEAAWLDDYALFMALRDKYGQIGWFDWPEAIRRRDPAALDAARVELCEAIDGIRFEQFIFFRQWAALREYARARGIYLFGDMPIYVAHDSAEVWAHPELFTLDERGRATEVAGVPPDYFSQTGQRWGNPLYRWARHQEDGFAWWLSRFATQLKMFDLVRIDHFRGLEAYWSIPASCETAVDGHWVKAPGDALLTALRERYAELPLVAEDLGIITEEVTALRQKHGLPGMRVLQFAFDDGPQNPHLPHNHAPDSVVYTGTHDNDTTLGWWNALDEEGKARVRAYLGRTDEAMPWALIRLAMESVAHLAIIPMQDVLALGSEARMNTPGTTTGNWRWRFDWAQWDEKTSLRLRREVEINARLP